VDFAPRGGGERGRKEGKKPRGAGTRKEAIEEASIAMLFMVRVLLKSLLFSLFLLFHSPLLLFSASPLTMG
jgi:hypothetical protein